jgi:hypothetical protein
MKEKVGKVQDKFQDISQTAQKRYICANVECTKFLCEVNEHTIPAHARLLFQRLLSSSESRRTAKSRRLNATNVAFTCAQSVLLPLCPRSCLVFFLLLVLGSSLLLQMQFKSSCSSSYEQEWWDAHAEQVSGGKLMAKCQTCLSSFCCKTSCGSTRQCDQCAHVSCKACDETYCCSECSINWCTFCRGRTVCSVCSFSVCASPSTKME